MILSIFGVSDFLFKSCTKSDLSESTDMNKIFFFK
jgi:hypothetical protein